MAPADLMLQLRRRPFLPFRIVTSDATSYVVTHPELVMVGTVTAIVGQPEPTQPEYLGRYDLVDVRHIVRLECLDSTANVLPPEDGNGQTAP